MRQVIGLIAAVLAGAGIMMMGYGLLGTLLAVRMSVEGFSPLVAGAVMSAFYAGQMVGAWHVRHFIESIGHIRAFSAFAALFASATLLHVMMVEPITWGVLRFAEGYFVAGLFMCLESWLNDRASNATRGVVFSLYMIIIYTANAAAQFLLTVADVTSDLLFMLVSILFSLALVPIALTRSPAPALPSNSPFGVRKLLAASPLGMIGCVTSGLTLGSFYSIAPSYAEKMGLDTLGIATLVSSGIVGGLLGQWPLGWLSDRMERRKVICGVALVTSVVSVALIGLTLWLSGQGMGENLMDRLPLFALIGALGVMIFALYPLSVAHANDFIAPQHFVAASGALLLAFAVGATVGPLAASALMEGVGPSGLFAFTAVSGLGLALFALWRHKVAAPVDAEAKTPFSPTTGTSLALAELDPRAGGDQLSFSFSFEDKDKP